MIKYFFIIAAIFLISCQEEVDLHLHNSSPTQVAVDGRIINQFKPQTFRLTKTIEYFTNEEVPPLLDANAYILENSTGKRYDLSLENSQFGIYKTPPFKGNSGETYKFFLQCSLGSYEATTKLDTITPLDSIKYLYQYNKGMKVGYYRIYISAYDPPAENYYRFYIYLNDTLINYKITDASASNDQLFNGLYLAGIEVYDIRQEWVKSNMNTLKVEMLSISKEEYTDINDFIYEITGSGSIFSGPSANIPSNIKNTSGGLDGLGFFAASAVSTKEMTLLKQHNDSTNNPNFKP